MRLPQKLPRLALNGMLLCILAALAFQAAFYLALHVQKARLEYDNSWGESMIVERARALALGEPLMPPSEGRWPVIEAVYAPLCYAIPAWTARAIGMPEGRWAQVRRIYLTGRAWSFVGTFVLLAWLVLFLRKMGLPWRWGALAALLFFSARLIIKFGYSYRADFLFLPMVFWAWYLAMRPTECAKSGDDAPAPSGNLWQRHWRDIASGALMALAFFTKQSALPDFGILFLWHLIDRRFARAVALGATWTILVAATMLALQTSTQGAYLAHNFLGLRVDHYWPGAYTSLLNLRPLDALPLIGGLLVTLGFPRTPEPWRMARWAFLVTLLYAEFALTRTGSDSTYYLAPYCWGIVLTTAACRIFWRRYSGSDWRWELPHPVWILAVVILFAAYGMRTRRLVSERSDLALSPPWTQRNADTVRWLGQIRGEILTTDGYAWFHTEAPPTMMDPMQFTVRTQLELPVAQDILATIRARRFSCIIMNWKAGEPPVQYQGLPLMPQEMLDAVLRHYEFEAYRSPYYIYHPKQ